MDQRPWDWLLQRLDGVAFALVATFSLTLVSAFLRGVSALNILLSLLASFALTSIAVPLAAFYWGLPWPLWPVIGGFVGITSLSIVWTAIRFADRFQQRAPDLADKVIDRLPGAKEGQQP